MSRLAGEDVEEQALPTKDGTVLVLDLEDIEDLPRLLEELHVGAPPLLETEVDGHRGAQRQQVRQRGQQQGERRLEVDAVGRQYDVGRQIYDLSRQRLTPGKVYPAAVSEYLRVAVDAPGLTKPAEQRHPAWDAGWGVSTDQFNIALFTWSPKSFSIMLCCISENISF